MTTAATAEENIDAETLPREKEERAHKKEDRGEVGEVPRKTSRRHAGLRLPTLAAP